MDKKNNANLRQVLNGKIFWGPAILTVLILIWGIAAPKSFANVANAALGFVLKYFNGFLVPLTFFAVVFCLWSAFSKFGNIRLGGENAKPKINTVSWFAIALSSGMGVGITYYATYQPLQLFYNPPEFLGDLTNNEQALTFAMRFSFLEWGLHPYALYTCAGVAIAFMFYNGKRKFRISDGLYPLLGNRVNGILGNIVDSFSIFVIVAGLGASAGLAIMQISQGIEYLSGVGNDIKGWLILTIVIGIIYTLASTTGLHKLMTLLGNLNLYLYIAILIFGLIVIDPFGIINTFWTSMGDYIQNFIASSLYLEPVADTGWVGNNNTFFFTWWMVFAPFSGLFLVKLAYGRTLREFILVNMILPALFVTAWFTVFGGGAILFDINAGGKIYELVQQMGPSMAWYALFDQLPLSGITNIIALIIVVLSFVTLADSMTLSLASISCKDYQDTTGETQPPRVLCIFWGVVIATFAFMLLYTGGRSSIETAVVVCGLPTGVLLLLLMISHIKGMINHNQYDLSDSPTKIE